MFDIGFQELIVIMIVGLLVVGPKRLPELSRDLGKWVREIKRGIHNAKVQIDAEFKETEKRTGVSVSEIRKDIEKTIATETTSETK